MRRALLVFVAIPFLPAAVDAAPFEWDLGVGAVHRSLREEGARGERLVREAGDLTQVEARARQGPLGLKLRVAQGRLGYTGQTQSGLPLLTSTLHTEAELEAGWTVWPSPRWGDVSVSISQLAFRRGIASTPLAGGLTETSMLTLPGISWRSPEWTPLRLQVGAGLRGSVRHRFDVDFGGLYDTARMEGGHRNEAELQVTAQPLQGWQFELGWRQAWQKASDDAPLSKDGAPVGSLRQPRIRMDDVSFSARYSF